MNTSIIAHKHDLLENAQTSMTGGNNGQFNQEPENNIRLVHERAFRPDPKYANLPLEWFIGRNVKLAFQSRDSRVEHMWVTILGIEGHDLVGRLANYPVDVSHLTNGDRVVLNRTQIERCEERTDD